VRKINEYRKKTGESSNQISSIPGMSTGGESKRGRKMVKINLQLPFQGAKRESKMNQKAIILEKEYR